MKRNVRIASLIMLVSLIGLLSFQVYWISTAYTQKRDSLEGEIKEAFSKANNGLLIRKLGDLSGINIDVTAEGSFFSADTLQIRKEVSGYRALAEMPGSRTITINASDAPFMEHFKVDTIISEVEHLMGKLDTQLETSVLIATGEISKADFSFMDSLLTAYLSPVNFERQYELSFGTKGEEEYDFTTDMHSFSLFEDELQTIIQPISFGSRDKIAKLVFPENQLVKASLSSISLIILASVVMLILLISAWYYIIRSLQRQYELTQMKDDFISNMTHELKTPVTASSLALEVLAKNEKVKSDSSLTDLIGVARSEQDRMLSMIESILESTTQNGLGDEALEVLSFNEELDAVSETVKLKVGELNGKLSLDMPESTVWVSASQVHLQNAVINLLENAIKYTSDAPYIKVRLSTEGKMAVLSVTDNGIGISKEDQKKVFEKFFRVSTGNVHTVKGYGLGLSYTKAVIESLGGSIELQSEPGKGSTFIIKLPRVNEG